MHKLQKSQYSALYNFTVAEIEPPKWCLGQNKSIMDINNVTIIRKLLWFINTVSPGHGSAYIIQQDTQCSVIYARDDPAYAGLIQRWQITICSKYPLGMFYNHNLYSICVNLPILAPHMCRNDHFTCPHSSTCIIYQYVCDGVKDCPHGEDEADCSIQCPHIPLSVASICERDLVTLSACPCVEAVYFECDSGHLIPQVKRCDNVVDCEDGSDERMCHNGCNSSQFQCQTGQCIAYQLR